MIHLGRSLRMMQVDIWNWSHTCWGHMAPIFQLDLSWPLTLEHEIWLQGHMTVPMQFPYYIHKPSLVPTIIGLQLFKWDQFYIFSQFYNLKNVNKHEYEHDYQFCVQVIQLTRNYLILNANYILLSLIFSIQMGQLGFKLGRIWLWNK